MKVKRDLANEINILNKMMTALVELLEEKGIVTNDEWEKRIQQKIINGRDE